MGQGGPAEQRGGGGAEQGRVRDRGERRAAPCRTTYPLSGGVHAPWACDMVHILSLAWRIGGRGAESSLWTGWARARPAKKEAQGRLGRGRLAGTCVLV